MIAGDCKSLYLNQLNDNVLVIRVCRLVVTTSWIRISRVLYSSAAWVSKMEESSKSPPITPAKASILKHSTGKILQLGSKMGTYILLSDILPQNSLGMVSFEVRKTRIEVSTQRNSKSDFLCLDDRQKEQTIS